MRPTVSICLPVYNGAAFLTAAIESVLEQTLDDFELLISDDGSTDQSLSIIESYAARDSRINFWTNAERVGLFANYNACMTRAKGEFVKPHAQDDLWERTLLEKELALLNQHPNVVLVGCRRRRIDSSGAPIEDLPDLTVAETLGASAVYSGRMISQRCLSPLSNLIGEPCAVMFRAAAMGKGFSTKFRHLGDLEYWLRILRDGDYGFVDDELVSFRKHLASTSVANASQLWHASDIIHLSNACQDLLSSIGRTRDDFIRESLFDFAHQFRHMLECGEVKLERLHEDSFLRRDDLEGIKEALMHSLILTSQSSLSSSYGPTYIETLENELAIRKQEAFLQSLLSSFSWRSTRLLRELNRSLSRAHGASIEDHITRTDEQEQYLVYLRAVKRDVLKSRSWKLTRPLRRYFRRDRESL